MKQSLLARAGIDKDKADAKDNAYNAMTLRELARASLVDRGISVAGQKCNEHGWIGVYPLKL